jgi:hypothetical protein
MFLQEESVAKYLATVGIILTVTAVFVVGQSETRKPAAPNTDAPTKVTGDGVKTDSGLQYWDIRVGNGDVAKEGSRVRVHYKGWHATGKSSAVQSTPGNLSISRSATPRSSRDGKKELRECESMASGSCAFRLRWLMELKGLLRTFRLTLL